MNKYKKNEAVKTTNEIKISLIMRLFHLPIMGIPTLNLSYIHSKSALNTS